eukprot:scaffold1004_cov269-Pinguiococcus_pyrenoidosus.AAC.18
MRWRVVAPRAEERHRRLLKGPGRQPHRVRKVCAGRWIVQSPIREIVVFRLEIPVAQRRVHRDLHPMALRFVVAKCGRRVAPTVRVQPHHMAHQERQRHQKGPVEEPPSIIVLCAPVFFVFVGGLQVRSAERSRRRFVRRLQDGVSTTARHLDESFAHCLLLARRAHQADGVVRRIVVVVNP